MRCLLILAHADKAPRGCLAFVPGNNQEYFLSLFATADKSTLFHELGHYLLEQFAYAATSPGASEELQADYAKALKWMGYASGHDRKLDLLAIRELLEEKRSRAAEGKKLPKKSQAILDAAIEKQERWAKAWESYLQDGKAPTPELATAFARLRVWLTDLYYRLKSKLPPLDDEIRGVFDRLLAAQEGVAEAQDEIGRGAVPDALMEVATEADKKRLRSLAASAKIKAEERLFALRAAASTSAFVHCFVLSASAASRTCDHAASRLGPSQRVFTSSTTARRTVSS